MNGKKIKIALIVGGISPEREISLESGKAMLKALQEMDYPYVLIDPAYGERQDFPEDFFFENKELRVVEPSNYIKCINSKYFEDVDFALIALHGIYGEDGYLQSLLDLRGVPYSGSGALASMLAMDKSTSKIMFQHFNVKIPNWFLVRKSGFNPELVQKKIEKFFGYPCIVKPNNQGSTIGLSRCENSGELPEAFEKAFRFGDKVLVENFIEGREIAVTVIGGKVLPILEIVPKHKIYDYECKYIDGMSKYITPAELSEKIKKQLEGQALLAFQSLGCKSYGRVDFRLSAEGKPYCLEVNTLPGMTSHSLVPKMARAKGISFAELIEMIITNRK